MPTWAPEGDKAAAWAKEDEAERLDGEAERLDGQVDEALEQALRVDPTLPEANHALAERLRARQIAAELRRDANAAAHAEARLRAHALTLPNELPLRARSLAWLAGDGALTVVTDPPGATVAVFRYETERRRLVPRFVKNLGPTPIHAAPLPFGSYLCELRHPERAAVRYPVHIERQGHWDGVPPNATAPRPVYLPRAYELDRQDRYVPAGWTLSGGDAAASDAMPRRRRWVDGFVIRAAPVTMAELIAFLDALVGAGKDAEALRFAPRLRGGGLGEPGALLLGRKDDGTFVLRPDADGDVWLPYWPANSIDWWTTVAFARWAADRDGLPWRLPGELEWEKAARGVDGRFFPWGDRFDPAFASMRSSHAGRPAPVSVTAFPIDESPYGVRGLAGNMRDWCAEEWVGPEDAPDGQTVTVRWPPSGDPTRPRVDKGGSWFDTALNLRAAGRRRNAPELRGTYLGFRLARPITG